MEETLNSVVPKILAKMKFDLLSIISTLLRVILTRYSFKSSQTAPKPAHKETTEAIFSASALSQHYCQPAVMLPLLYPVSSSFSYSGQALATQPCPNSLGFHPDIPIFCSVLCSNPGTYLAGTLMCPSCPSSQGLSTASECQLL